MRTIPRLRIVRNPAPKCRAAHDDAPNARAGHDAAPDVGDVALIAALFLLNLVPVAGELTGIGIWSPAVVGFATGALLLTGRELWFELRAALRSKR
jgi:hypothetical protein